MKKPKNLYKKIIKLRKNILNKKKILNFKKQKWQTFLFHLKKNVKWYKKKAITINKLQVSRFASRGNSFEKKFRNNLQNKQRFNLFFGTLTKKRIRKHLKNITYKTDILETLERRLDMVLFRSNFSYSVNQAQQMISHGYITVNNKTIRSKSYLLKKGDLISIKKKYKPLIRKNFKKLKKTEFWTWYLPPTYLIIKYTTLQIIFGEIKKFNFSLNYPFKIDLDAILSKYTP